MKEMTSSTDCNRKNYTFKKLYFWNLFRINSILFFILVETKTKVPASKLTLFDVHRWSRSRDTSHCLKELKNELVQSRVFPHCAFMATRQPFSVLNNGENWTKWFFDNFRKWSVSRLLDHPWTSNKVCFEASTYVSTNMKK